MSAYHGLTLAVLAVVAVGTFMYSYFRNRPQGYEEQPSSHYSVPYIAPTERPPSSRSSSSRKRRVFKTTDTCSICFDSLANKAVKKLECNHFFHDHCIRMWFAENKTCPLCRHGVA